MSAANHTKIPLDGLFAHLRRENFDISTSAILDIQKVLANLDELTATDVDNLPMLIGPLICRNKDEQEKFYKICRQYFDSLNYSVDTQIPVPPQPPRYGWKIAAAVAAALIFLAIWYWRKPAPSTTLPEEVSEAHIVNKRSGDGFIIGDSISFAPKWKTADSANFDVSWTINGMNYNRSSVDTVFPTAGEVKYAMTVKSRKTAKDHVSAGTMNISCEPEPRVAIQKITDSLNGQTYLTADLVNSSGRESDYSYRWYIRGKFISGQKKFYSDFNPDSSYEINLVVDVAPNVHCSKDSITDTFVEAPEITMIVSGSGAITPSTKLDAGNAAWLVFGLLLLPSLVAWYLHRTQRNKRLANKVENEKPSEENKLKAPLKPQTEEKVYTGPYTIDINSKDELIGEEIGISQLAETLRKRHSSDTYQLNLSKTIRHTIRGGGFPSLQFTAKTKPADFLILLDKEYPDGHITHLFSWVIGKLKKEEVQFTLYSFYKEPLLLSNESMNQRLLPIDKVARLYPDSIVLIFSQAQGFFTAYYPKVKQNIAEKFRNWDTKLIITPNPKNDWGSKEIALYDAGFTVIPADTNAHQLISDEINYMIDKQKLKKTIIPDSYGTQYNFNRWKSIELYLQKAAASQSSIDQSALKDWIAATAVYPHINWNVTIAIGKAIEEKKYKTGQLVNYSNLLILSRILWMNDGQVSESLRRDLLIHLDPQTEAIARMAVLKLLKEIESSVKADSLIADELTYLQTTNKFLLNTYDSDKHQLSKPEYDRMKEFVERDQLDWVLQDYLSKPSNNTLLKAPDNRTIVTPEKYFEIHARRDQEQDQEKIRLEKEREERRKAEERKKRMRERIRTAASFVLSALVALLILSWLKVPQQLYSPTPSSVTVQLADNPYYNSIDAGMLQLLIDTSTYNTDESGVDSLFMNEDSVATAARRVVEFRNIVLQKAGNKASFLFAGAGKNFQTAPDTLFSNYTISFKGPLNKTKLFVRYKQLDRKTEDILQSLRERYTVSAELQKNIDSSYIIYYNEASRSTADSIVSLLRAPLNQQIHIEYLPENRTPPAPPILFLGDEKILSDSDPIDPNTMVDSVAPTACSDIPVNQLPAALTEIWSGSNNNRFIRIEIAKNSVYYSTGAKTTYGRYTIAKVCNANGTYRMILKGDKTYRLCVVRSVQSASFELAFCQQEFNSIADAEAAPECTGFNKMSLYYLRDANTVYVPLNMKTYRNSELAKMNQFREPNTSATFKIFVNSQNEEAVRLPRNSAIKQFNILRNASNITWNNDEGFTGTPFDRDYITISNITKGDPPVDQQTNNADSTEYLLAEITFDEKDYIRTGQSSFIEELGSYLRSYKQATARLSITYAGDMGERRATARLNMIRDMLQKSGASVKQLSVSVVPSRAANENANSVYESNLNKVVIQVRGMPERDREKLKGYLRGKAAN